MPPSVTPPPLAVPCPAADRDLVLDGTLEVGEGLDAADRRETFPRLRLAAPVCVALDPLEGDGPVRVVASELQLVGDPAALRALRGRSGPARVTGRAEAGITAHHHALLLLEVTAASGEVDAGAPAGAWVVRDAVPGPISAWSDAEAAGMVGRTVVLGAEVIAPWTTCADPRWSWTLDADGPGWDATCADGTHVTLAPAADGGWWTAWDGARFRLGR
jgi:hypothetical protein